VEQVAVGRVQLDTVESRFDRVGRSGREMLLDGGDLVGLDRPRGRERELLARQPCHALGPDRARCDRLQPAGDDPLVADPPAVHHLDERTAAGTVDRIRDETPARDLLGGLEAGLPGVRLARMMGKCTLGDDQACRCALCVVLGVERTHHPVGRGPHPRQRGHHEPVGQLEPAQVPGLEKGLVHRVSLSVRLSSGDEPDPRPAQPSDGLQSGSQASP
jgi:hypothetical protein